VSAAVEPGAVAAAPRSGVPTVLCVDDEPNILQALRRMLRREGYRILTAGSGREGLEVLAAEPVSLILSDQRMPGMSGTDFLSEARKIQPDAVRIILSGYAEIQAVTDAVNRGAIYKFVYKPWDDEEMRLTIRLALGQFELDRKNREQREELVARNAELERRTRELEERNRLLELGHSVLEELPVAAAALDGGGQVLLANRRAQELLVRGGSWLAQSIETMCQEAALATEESGPLQRVVATRDRPVSLTCGSLSERRCWLCAWEV
jgi:DNA-binding response OmpR family regulator